MGRIIDLGTMVKEPLTFNNCPDGKTYIIPGGISTEFVLSIQKIQGETKDLTEEESIDKLFDIVTMILSLDKSKEVNKNYVKKHFDNIRILNAITEELMRHIAEVTNDPN